MSDDFVILHLSDAHIGNPKHQPDISSVFQPLLTDLQVVSRDVGKPNLVIFSGDLAYGQIPEISLADQYRQAMTWIGDVYAALETTRDVTPLLLVPGNHDLNDLKVGRDQVEWVKKLEGEQGVEEVRSFMQAADVEWTRMLERQAEWVQFFKSSPGPWTLDENLNMVTGTIDHCGTTIGIAGLNSSWASSPTPKLDFTNGRLWIGKHQLQLALNQIDDANFKIAVAHHPTSWLNPAEKNWISQRIESKFHLFLHGHDHSQWFLDSPKHLLVAAGACYQRSDKDNAYSWVTLNFHRETAEIRLRTYSDRGEGAWIPFNLPGKTDEKGFARMVFPNKGVRKAANSSAIVAQTGTDARIGPTNGSALPENVRDYMSLLRDRFGFRWEPSSFRYSHANPLVYWPVRLRHPTPIHAVQCFAAAGLQRCGCEIVLCVDDLGHRDYSLEEFRKTMQRWFSSAGGDDSRLTTRECSELLETDSAADIWTQVKQWLGETTYPLDKVLRVSKLLSAENETSVSIEDLRKQRPRRLLTPAVVWTCLLYLHHPDETRPIITLAGYDEKPLWQAWRDCSNEPEIKVGHLYAPELNQSDSTNGVRPVHMSATEDLAWESREDISNALNKEFASVQSSSDWLNAHRLIPWCFRQCVLLPAWLNNSDASLVVDGEAITQIEELQNIEPNRLILTLVEALDKWLL